MYYTQINGGDIMDFMSCIDDNDFRTMFLQANMIKDGFIPMYDYNLYVREGYGAYIGNVLQGDMESYRKNGISYQEYIDKGYQLVIGPGAPSYRDSVIGYGLYCKNWEEFVDEKHKMIK